MKKEKKYYWILWDDTEKVIQKILYHKDDVKSLLCSDPNAKIEKFEFIYSNNSSCHSV